MKSKDLNILILLDEMIINPNEFSDIMRLPLPKEEPRSPIRSQYLMDKGTIKLLKVIRKVMEKRT